MRRRGGEEARRRESYNTDTQSGPLGPPTLSSTLMKRVEVKGHTPVIRLFIVLLMCCLVVLLS